MDTWKRVQRNYFEGGETPEQPITHPNPDRTAATISEKNSHFNPEGGVILHRPTPTVLFFWRELLSAQHSSCNRSIHHLSPPSSSPLPFSQKNRQPSHPTTMPKAKSKSRLIPWTKKMAAWDVADAVASLHEVIGTDGLKRTDIFKATAVTLDYYFAQGGLDLFKGRDNEKLNKMTLADKRKSHWSTVVAWLDGLQCDDPNKVLSPKESTESAPKSPPPRE
jgi:hypothetical protein